MTICFSELGLNDRCKNDSLSMTICFFKCELTIEVKMTLLVYLFAYPSDGK